MIRLVDQFGQEIPEAPMSRGVLAGIMAIMVGVGAAMVGLLGLMYWAMSWGPVLVAVTAALILILGRNTAAKTLALFLCALPLFAEGGIQAVPPWPNQTGTELIVNGDFEDLTGITLGACASLAAGQGVGGSDAIEIDGNCTAITFPSYTSQDADAAPWTELSFQVLGSSGSNYEIRSSTLDTTHGSVGPPQAAAFFSRLTISGKTVIGEGPDFLESFSITALAPGHDGESRQIRIISESSTTGTLLIDNVSLKAAWYPLYNFVKYPNHKGYLWSGYASHLCGTPAADCIAGFADVRPPTGLTLADVYVNEYLDTEEGCPTPIETQRYDPATRRIFWQLDGSAIDDDERYYVCAELLLDSDDSLVADFPDWSGIKRTTSWRTANLLHWIDDYGRWVDGTTPRFMWMTYLRFAGPNCTGCMWTEAAGGAASYLNGIKLLKRSIWQLLQASGRNVVLYFSPASGMNPVIASGSNNFRPYYQALDSLGMHFWQIAAAHIQGGMFGGDRENDGDESPAPPTVNCSSSGGSISAAYVYARVAGVGGAKLLQTDSRLLISDESAEGHDGPLTGSTNSCVITPPACSQRETGFWVYAATAASEVEPADGAYSLQTTRFIDCGRSMTLTEILDTGWDPPTQQTGSLPGNISTTGRSSTANWIPNSMTTNEVLDAYNLGAEDSSALLGMYLGDETMGLDAGPLFREMEYLNATYPERINFALPLEVRSIPGVDWFYSPILDINGQDIYYADLDRTSLSAESRQALNNTNRTATCYAFSGSNATYTEDRMSLSLLDEWVDLKMRSHEGSRMNLALLQQWSRFTDNCWGWTLDELRKQIWKAVIAMQNWGSISGLGTWGWVTTQGLFDHADIPASQVIGGSGSDDRGNTLALDADITAGAQLMALEHVLLEPVDDSTRLGFGTVLDGAPTSSISLPTSTCTLFGSPVPIRTVAKQMANGDQWIFATNLCPDSQTMTFSLADATGKIATDYFTGATYTITDGDFDVASTDFGVHVIKVETPKGGGIRGR